jgi:SAM-dependent methyltransferase
LRYRARERGRWAVQLPGQKDEIRRFYAAETLDRDQSEWIASGGSAHVPENAASRYFLRRKVTTALEMTGLGRASAVLEVGSSWGHQTFLLAERVAHVTGVDLSSESIDLARRRAAHWAVRNVRFEVGDAEDLAGHADASFDGVLSFSTLRFCPQPERALREMCRVLRSGGRLAVDFPNAACPWYGPLKRGLGISPHIHDRLFTGVEAQALVDQAGFTDVRRRTLLFTSKRVPGAMLPAFRLLDIVGERVPGLRDLAGIVMVSGRKRASG